MDWFDKRLLYMLSTTHKPTYSLPTTVLCIQGDGSRVDVDCPSYQTIKNSCVA